MSDIEFDDLMNILRSESPDSRVLKEVGAKPAGSVGLHSIPMGSLKEAKTMEEMQAWMSDINGGFLVMAKVDGLSLSLDYERGKLVQALTRGNGKVGEDVTANVLMMQNVSKELTGFTGTLRGEAYLPVKIFKEKYAEDYANPRNTAVGIVRRHSGEGAEDVALLYFYVEEHRRNGGDYVATFDTQSRMLLYIRNYLRLKTVDAFQTKDIATFRKAWADVEATRYKKDYEMDGVVVYVENICERRVGNPFLPDHAFVYKFEPETAKTTVTMIEHVAGRSGRVNPRVHVEPVKVGGVTVTHATGNNYPWLKNLGVGVGAVVEVSRRGDTIPAIEIVLRKGDPIRVPDTCPACDGPLSKDGAYLKCSDIECGAKDSGKVAHWLKLIEIKGVGKKMLAKLVDLGIKRPYHLYEHDDRFWRDNLGVNGVKVHQQLLDKKVVSPEIVLAAHVSNVGRRRFRTILDGLGGISEVFGAHQPYLEVLDGIGRVIAETVVSAIDQEKGNIVALMKHIRMEQSTEKGDNLKGWAMKFTGAMVRKRKDLENLAEKQGAKIGWTKGMRNILVINDTRSQSTKAKAARTAGHELMSEAEFISHAGA